MSKPRIFGRSGSHFTRIARMVALEASVETDFQVIPDFKDLDPEPYGGNPSLKLPTLVVDGAPVFGTVTICRRLVATSPNGFTLTWPETMSPDLQNAWELLSQAMINQVQVVFGVIGTGLSADLLYFRKAAEGLHGATAWLEDRLPDLLAQLPPGLSLFEIALFCQLEHQRFRPAAGLRDRPNLEAFRLRFAERPSAQATPFVLDAPAS